MDQLQVHLNSFPPAFTQSEIESSDEEDVLFYISSLSTIHKSPVAANKASELLANVDPSINSVGYVAVLFAAISADPHGVLERPDLLSAIVDFVSSFSPWQVRYVGSLFTDFLKRVTNSDIFSPQITTQLLATAILRLDPSGSVFTSTHYLLMKFAAETKSYASARLVADCDILYYPTPSTAKHYLSGSSDKRRHVFLGDKSLSPAAFITIDNGFTDKITPVMVLEYNYLRGLVLMSGRQWSKAAAAFLQTVTHPAKERGVSNLMVEAHRKWLLTGVLSKGKTPELPSYAPPATAHSCKGINGKYADLAAAFTDNNSGKLKNLYEEHKAVWQQERNLLLVEEVMQSYQKWQILHLRNAYSHITLGQVLEFTQNAYTGRPLQNEQEAAELIQSMMNNGMLAATLEAGEINGQAVTYVVFGETETASTLTEADYAHEIARCHQSVTALTAQYKVLGERLAGSDAYVKNMAIEKARAEKEGLDPGIGFDSQIEDEDLMTGIMAHG